MPSTYSNLKIQLMATGENTTTWGNVTNVNLGTALEEAIAGSADVTFASNNQTLTLTNTNATQTARNMRLRCTGTTGGSTRDLVVPTIEKPYIVQNDCADSVVVKTSAGTGITVPAGKTMWVYADGTNVVDATTHLTSLTLGTALAVTQGGTGQTTFTNGQLLIGNTTGNTLAKATLTAGTNISITNGTGSITINSTDQFVGTVTSVALSGGTTGLTVSGSPITTSGTITLAGTLAVANGGTGQTTFTNGQLLIGNTTGNTLAKATLTAGTNISITNGTGSITINSTDQFVGTVTSVALSGGTTGLTVSGSPITTSGTITLAGTLAVANGGTGATTLTGVVIGNGTSAFTIKTNPTGDFVGTSDTQTLTNKTINGTNNTITNASLTTAVTGTLPVLNGGTGQTTFTNGQLLIGNTTGNTLTKATLTAGSGISVTNSTGSITIAATGGTGTVTSVALSGGTTGLTVSGSPITTSGTITLAGTLAVANGGTGVTTSTGTVAVVLSTSPTLITPILGAATATSIANGLGAVGTPAYTFTGDLNTGMWSPAADTVAVSTDGSERMRVISTGNVGIGTSSPTARLSVTSGSAGLISSFSDGVAQGLQILTGTGFAALLNPNNGAITIRNFSNTTEYVRVDDSGNVGINVVPSGTYKLEVSGATYASSLVLGAALPVASGGTGATDAPGARSALSAAASGANTDITALDQDITITATGTIAADTIGFRGIPQNAQTGAYTLVLADAGKHISNTTGGFAIPANGTTAFPVGTTIVVYNNSASTQTITITTDTLRLAGTATTGSLTLAQRGLATCVKVASTEWVASGNLT